MVIAAFLESIRQPDEFREVCELALRAGKPIVALKTDDRRRAPKRRSRTLVRWPVTIGWSTPRFDSWA